MIYGSVCSGIEAATVAWETLGWKAAFFSEIEKFPRQVLQHHYPDTPLHGDFTTIGDEYEPIELLVGGTPCQSFSVAGLRKGMDDERGNLALEYLRLADRLRPQWLVWENVPGVLSSNGGRDFGSFLGALQELGYGFAYRILDAQYFGVAQRRRRVFVVGYLGDWRCAAAVLFERHSLSGDSAPSREAGQKAAPTVTQGAPFSRTGNQRVEIEALVPAVAGSLDTQCGGSKLTHQSANNGHLILEKDLIGTLTARMFAALGARDVEEGALHPVAFDSYNQETTGSISKTLAARSDQDTASCIAFPAEMSGTQAASAQNISPTLSVGHTTALADHLQVRRLTPIECERLQGFPDNYTRIPWRNKSAVDCPDGPRYKAIGNSMAVPVMRWIGERIAMVDAVKKISEAAA